MAEDIGALVAKADLPAIAAAFTELKQRGGEFVSRCVFHSPDEHPSLSFYRKNGKWNYHCWSCGEQGDALDWIEKLEGLDTAAALRRLNGGTQWKPIASSAPAVTPMPERMTGVPPADAASPDFRLRALGEPEMIFALRDLDGSLLGYECRYKGAEGRKEIRMWTWGARGDAAPSWGCGHFNVPRPLFGLERLAQFPDIQVQVFEGPKKADACKRLLTSYPSISWTGGAQAWHKHNWRPLKGRKVLLWPDADEPGWTTCEKLAALLADPRGLACEVRLVDTNRMPEGWDVADAEAEGWDAAKLLAWVKPRARDWEPPDEPPSDAAGIEATNIPPEPGTSSERPKRGKPRLAAVDGNAALAPAPDIEPQPQAMSEDALADHFAVEHKDNWRRVAAWDKWFCWDGDGWIPDTQDARVEPMRDIFRQAMYWPEAAGLTVDAKRKLCRQAVIYAAVRLAGTDRRIRTTPEIWDADPWMLGVPGGVIDLHEGKLIEAAREQCITMRCAVAPERGTPELWLRMLAFWMGGDEDLIGWLRRYLGYALTGDNREQCMAFFYGPAQSGKGTIARTIAGIMGSSQVALSPYRSYHYEAPIATFLESRNERHSTELAALYGKRLITAEEPSAGAKWDEGKLKWITGGSQITARFVSRDNFSFSMTGKLIVAANHRPRLATTDSAIKRRLHVVPFEHPISDEERDNQLDAKLREEWPQILHWLIEGCLEWQQCGLGLPERIAASTQTYLESEDTLGAWLEECCERLTDSEGAALYKSYADWCERNGDQARSRRAWANELVDRGFQTRKGTGGIRMIRSLNLKPGANLP